MHLATIEAAQQILTTGTKSEESDIPVEENEEPMLPEDGILLTYMENLSWKNKETEMAEIQTTQIVEVPECDADIPMPTPRDDDKISDKSQKS